MNALIPDGYIAANSANDNETQTYINPTNNVDMINPPNPPLSNPKFQPKKSPEMTAPTPRAVNGIKPCCRFNGALSVLSALSAMIKSV